LKFICMSIKSMGSLKLSITIREMSKIIKSSTTELAEQVFQVTDYYLRGRAINEDGCSSSKDYILRSIRTLRYYRIEELGLSIEGSFASSL